MACDGTHIGDSLRHLKLEKPVTKPDKKDIVPWIHHRPHRHLLADKYVRRHVKYMCRKVLNLIKPEHLLSASDEMALSLETFHNLEKETPLKKFLEPLFSQTGRQDYLEICAEFLHTLSGEDYIGAVVHVRSIPLLQEIIGKVERSENCAQELGMMRKYNPHISDLFWIAPEVGKVKEVIDFLRYLIDKVESIHYTHPNPTEAQEMLDTYDPRTGVACYFNESGNQMHELPIYQADIDGHKYKKDKTHADETLDEGECRKKYPLVSFGGYSYILLWFCPLHGHCYGFHLIDGAEGRKDPFCSLVKYMEEMPEELFYDFACSLSEYCLNREPQLFKNTRFWHDLFHAIGHMCGINFKSTKVEGMDGVNSEICEQVNSYLQCIKYTGSHLSQEHFVFFLQFFLYLLNEDKTERQREMAKIALAGHE